MADYRRLHGRLSREPKRHVVTMATLAIVTMAILLPRIAVIGEIRQTVF
jgi:hypothetical protein